jgi:phosphotransferase system enzyme I (PtsP)
MHDRQTALAFRRLLARVRDVMAGEGDAHFRLDRIVAIVAEEMAAEVCSVYVRRAGEVLELFATRGLRASAVHLTRLRFGEGLIGKIAATGRPLALADAQKHPSFVYRPETGEEIYHSLLGVPVLGHGRAIGTLAVQSTDRREYRDDEVEILQTIAMVVAQLILSGELVGRDELAPTEGIVVTPRRLEGAALNGGIGLGIAVHHRPQIAVRRFVADDAGVEHRRLDAAVNALHGTLDDILLASVSERDRGYRSILESYRMIAADVGWLRRIGEAIDTGLTAEAAVQKTANEIQTWFAQVSDAYLRERVDDFEDLSRRLLQHLLGVEDTASKLPACGDIVLVARNMGPTELLDYERSRLRGLIFEEGSPTAHVIIVAQALDVPVVGHVRGALDRIDPGDTVVVDADHAQVFVRPSEDIRQAFRDSLAARKRRDEAYLAARDLPAATRDGVPIGLHINAGLLVDLTHLDEVGADGIGLYRTEIPFLVRAELPDVNSQERLYRRVLDYAKGRPVVFRTLDIGGDKVVANWERIAEHNPAMGWRAMRVSLDRPATLRQQLRAMIRAAAGDELAVMFPMIAEIDELAFAKRILEMELDRERNGRGRLPKTIQVGAMLEVPAMLFQLHWLLPKVDFLAVGTNDLLQFLFAADRGSARLGQRYDPVSPVVLNVLGEVVRQCREGNVPVSVCGEIAAEPLAAMALVGIGFRSLSLPPSRVGPVKMMIRSLHLPSLERYLESLRQSSDPSIRSKLTAYARDHGVSI